ncbi:MAG: glycosyltransferase family 4 protein [Alphaproteobacteria bacterium]|nr:glycosyltransferase family 4 protein [Alphaproteobacteria bacterium]
MRKKLLFVVNVDWFFVSHRLPIAVEAMREGYEVHLATQMTDLEDRLRDLGIICHPMKIDRSYGGALHIIHFLWSLFQLFRTLRPDIVHLVSIKPVIFGGIAARLTGTKNVVASISGLGFVFIAKGVKATLRRWLVRFLYRLSLGNGSAIIIVQNTTDREEFLKMIGKPKMKTVLVNGSGVDMNEYTVSPLPDGPCRVLMGARLLRDKGLMEYMEAAQTLRAKRPDMTFLIAGDVDPGNPATIDQDELANLKADGSVEFLGHVSDMASLMASCHLVVLPSYREGLPRVLIEAAACGRAVVTTDVPGCRDAIVPGKTGLLAKSHDAQSLTAAIEQASSDRQLLEDMGKAGRQFAETTFDVQQVVDRHMDVYKNLSAV